jgi:hypothetical protein
MRCDSLDRLGHVPTDTRRRGGQDAPRRKVTAFHRASPVCPNLRSTCHLANDKLAMHAYAWFFYGRALHVVVAAQLIVGSRHVRARPGHEVLLCGALRQLHAAPVGTGDGPAPAPAPAPAGRREARQAAPWSDWIPIPFHLVHRWVQCSAVHARDRTPAERGRTDTWGVTRPLPRWAPPPSYSPVICIYPSLYCSALLCSANDGVLG